ncbi:hypothetical protein TCSYLVIO_008012 [Trypanosoma cruzi]|nr:hypothetical protein TCSYLVIO_008012 [Trypanosoma cruzi]
MTAHARRAQPGVIIVGEGLPCGCHNGTTVLLTGASRAGHHRSCQAYKQARHAGSTNAGIQYGTGFSATASSQTPRAADSTADHGRLRPVHCGNALVVGIGTVTVWDCLSPFATEYLPPLHGRPLRCSLVIVAAKTNRGTVKQIVCVMNIGCTSRGTTIHVVCGDHFPLFIVSLPYVLLCALHLFLCVCVPSVRVRARRTALAVCACGGALCAAPVCFSLLHLCVCACALYSFFLRLLPFVFTFSAFCYCRFIYDARGVVLCLPLYWSHLLCAVASGLLPVVTVRWLCLL